MKGSLAAIFFPLHGRILVGRSVVGRFLPRKKNFRGFAAKIFSAFTIEFGAHGAPYFTQPGTQGPLLYPGGAHGAPFTVGFPTKKKFTRACAREFFLSKSVFYINCFIEFSIFFILSFLYIILYKML